MNRTEALTFFFSALQIHKIEILHEDDKSISGTVFYNNDNTESQDFIWEIPQSEIPKDDVFKLACFLGKNNLVNIDRLEIDRKELHNKYCKETACNIAKEEFDYILEQLLTISIHFIDEGEKSDSFFLHE